MPPATTPGTDRLLHCSPDRTLYTTTDPTSGERVVCKVFVRGSQTDAEREVQMGQMVAHLDVVTYLRTELDTATNRPCVIAKLHEGVDLDVLVAHEGALPPARAVAALLPVALTLAAMHGLNTAATPRGICHGDVKPKNLLMEASTTRVLDFEHARAIGGSNRGGHNFTGGTLPFAPPEASQGRAPNAAFDVYGLGATLRWLLSGGHDRLPPIDADLQQLLSACLADNPEQRPTMATVAEACQELAKRLAKDPQTRVVEALTRGDLEAAHTTLAAHAALRANAGLVRMLTHAQRVLLRLPQLLVRPDGLPTEPASLQRELTTAQRILRWFPSHPGTLQWRRRLQDAAGTLVTGAAEHTSSLRRAEAFDAASRWLDESRALLQFAALLPGGCPLPPPADPRSIGLLHRAPLEFLRLHAQELEAARAELLTANAEITAAEEHLDLAGAELAIDQLATQHGGSSPTAARRRDGLHRLAFYLQRVARAHGNVEQLGRLWDATALEPLLRFVTRNATAAADTARKGGPTGPVGLRSLQVTLLNLVEEFPHLSPQVDPALEALSQALEHTTDQSWGLLAEAQQKLQAVPVPVRPLQMALGRLDTFRILEAFVDRPERPRSLLLDGIESLRLALEQARATRDRLTHGAEQALARGHWTTGLFDMERAVAGLNQGDEHDREEAQRLRDRLAEAKRHKQEIEAAVRRNVELATRYGMLQDEADSSFAARLQVLTERRDGLLFLAMNLPAERGALYSRDLREVETLIALEQAAFAENELDSTEDPLVRLRLARATLEQLGASFTVTDLGNELPGRMQRLLEHWRTVAAQCQREVERLHAAQEARLRHRRRLLAMATGAVLALITAIGFAAKPWLWGEATASSRTPPPSSVQHVLAAPDAEIARLAATAAGLPTELQASVSRLLSAVQATRATTFDAMAWQQEFTAAMLAMPSRADTQPFQASAWQIGLILGIARCDATTRSALEVPCTQLARQLSANGVELGISFADILHANER
jgi:hypothetical protein